MGKKKTEGQDIEETEGYEEGQADESDDDSGDFSAPVAMKEYEKALEEVSKKSAREEFDTISAMLYRFEKEGQTMTGIYLGTAKGHLKNGSVWQHYFATKVNGRNERVFMNGTHQLTKTLKQVPVGTPVRIQFIEKVQAGQGNVSRYDIAVLRNS